MQIEQKEFKLKSGKTLTLRSPQREDATAMIDFVKQVSEDAPYILLGPGEFNMTVEQEEGWIKSCNEGKGDVLITAWIGDELVGITNANASKRKKYIHVAHLGTSVSQRHRGQGIGTFVMEELVNWAKAHNEIEILQLSVMSGNDVAIKLYQRYDFVKRGEVPNAFKVNGEYHSEIIMSRSV